MPQATVHAGPTVQSILVSICIRFLTRKETRNLIYHVTFINDSAAISFAAKIRVTRRQYPDSGSLLGNLPLQLTWSKQVCD